MCERIVASSDESPSQIQASIERLAKFYESWDAAEPGKGYDTKAAEWRTRSVGGGPDDDETEEPTP